MFIHRYLISQLPVDTTNTKISSKVVILTVNVKLVDRKVKAHVGIVIVMKAIAEKRMLGSITRMVYAIPAEGAADGCVLLAADVLEATILVALPASPGKAPAIGDVMIVLRRTNPHGTKFSTYIWTQSPYFVT